jgi:hypothetical protein
MNAYQLVMSDGKTLRVEAQCAADAIANGLEIFRGRTVRRCFQGFSAQDKNFAGGGTEIDVPKHRALPESAGARKQRPVEDTAPFPFFNPQAKS